MPPGSTSSTRSGTPQSSSHNGSVSRPSISKPGSLSSVVSSLVRAQYGIPLQPSSSASTSGTGKTGADESDLDKHVADLLLKEAQERAERAQREKAAYWTFSDEEDDPTSSKKRPKTANKRFLSNLIQQTEDHNVVLRRQESQWERENGAAAKRPVKDLAAIRRKEREERERRTGVKDDERTHRKAGDASEEREARSDTASSSRPRLSNGPGFAARTLASGLSDAMDIQRKRQRQERAVQEAVESARSKARELEKLEPAEDRHYEVDRKGKGRARDDASYSESRESLATVSRTSPRSSVSPRASRLRSADGRNTGESDRPRRRHRSRSRSPNRYEERLYRSEHSSRDRDKEDRHGRKSSRKYKDDEREHYESDRRRRDSRSTSRRGTPERSRSRSRSRTPTTDREDRSSRRERSSRHRDHGREKDRDTYRKRRRSPSPSRSIESSDLSDHSSDTFIDPTTLPSAPSASTSSKMDKYFSSTYDPALDVSVEALTDAKTGLIAEGNFDAWSTMLDVLKKRKEDKVFGVSRAREEEREKELRRMERRQRREERELRRLRRKEKKKKRKRRGSDESDESDSSGSEIGPKVRREPTPPRTVVLDGFEYVTKGSTRAWDLGKEATL